MLLIWLCYSIFSSLNDTSWKLWFFFYFSFTIPSLPKRKKLSVFLFCSQQWNISICLIYKRNWSFVKPKVKGKNNFTFQLTVAYIYFAPNISVKLFYRKMETWYLVLGQNCTKYAIDTDFAWSESSSTIWKVSCHAWRQRCHCHNPLEMTLYQNLMRTMYQRRMH